MAAQERETSYRRGYGRRWQLARLDYLKENPLCVSCLKQGLIRAAEVVDHIKPHKGDLVLFWDRDNWQSLCKPCHDDKTLEEMGKEKHKLKGCTVSGMPTDPRHPWYIK